MSVHAYLREQDAEALRASHVVWAPDGRSCGATFGARATGLPTKTGWGQGVVMDDDYVLTILRRRMTGLKGQDRIFPLSSTTYARWWLGNSSGSPRAIPAGAASSPQCPAYGRIKRPQHRTSNV